MKITYLKHNEINKTIWDKKIKISKNTTAYAFSWFLDIVSPNWEAIVSSDYEFIMPLPKSIKYFVNYIKRPTLLQKIGIISNKTISNNIAEAFINSIPEKYKVIDIPFFNNLNFKLDNGFIKKRNNYELNLNYSYNELYKSYSKNHKKNIKRAIKNNLLIENFFDIDLYLNLRLLDDKFYIYKNYKKQHLNELRLILEYSKKNKLGEMYFVKDINGEFIAAIFYLIQNNKAIKFSTRTALGKKLGAGFLIIDNFIKSHSYEELTLDFVGSDIEGIAYFNKGFGAIINEYSHVYINRLKFPFNLLKK